MFNGNVIFEFSLFDNLGSHSQSKLMNGIEKLYDGYIWSNTNTTNIKNEDGLMFRLSTCIGHL